MDGIDNKYIKNAITNLANVIGVKENVEKHVFTTLISEGKVKESIGLIANYLGLPVKINLSYVPKGYRADSTNNFDSTCLVKTDWRGRGTSGITAQVYIPSNLPLYGSPSLNNFPITVKISEDCAENKETFIAVMAHELSHIVLASLRHPEKDNEIYTDIASLMLGFSGITQEGRKVVNSTQNGYTIETQTVTYGYLSDEQFSFAIIHINEIVSRYKTQQNSLKDKINVLECNLGKGRKMIADFQGCLAYVDKNLNRKVSQADGYSISSFHQVGYTDDFRQAIAKTENDLKRFNSFVKSLSQCCNENIFNRSKQYEENFSRVSGELDLKYNKLKDDIKILKRYVSFGYKLKSFFKVYFGN